MFQSRGRDLLIGKQLSNQKLQDCREFQSRGRDLLIGKLVAYACRNCIVLLFQSRGRDLLIGKFSIAVLISSIISCFSPVVGIY